MTSRLGRRLARKKPGLIFLHVPKTGGSSIANALRRHYPLCQFHVRAAASLLAAESYYARDAGIGVSDEDIQRIRIPLVHYGVAREAKYVYGHVWFDESFIQYRSRGYLLMTCLRDPVNRFFSHYFWNRYKPSSHDRTDLDFEQYLNAETTFPLGSLFVRYLGGIRDDGDYRSSAAIANAVERVSHFDLVGRLENLDGLKLDVKKELGIDLKPGHQKPSPGLPSEVKRVKGSQQLRSAVEELCRPDIEFYRRVTE